MSRKRSQRLQFGDVSSLQICDCPTKDSLIMIDGQRCRFRPLEGHLNAPEVE